MLCLLPSGALAQSSITLYGRVDLSLAQQADAVKNREVRNGSGSRLGVRGIEDLGDGLQAVFNIEHRFNADTGSQTNAVSFWEGTSIVGLQGAFGRVSLGREENPAYTYGQSPADPWATDTIAGNGSIINGRIGSTRYSNSINYRFSAAGFTFGGQYSEAEGNTPAGTDGALDDQPYSLGLGYAAGPFSAGIGHENPADADDNWTSGYIAWNFGLAKVGAFYGRGDNTAGQRHESYMAFVTAPLGSGELRVSYGRLKNKSSGVVTDEQLGAGYHYALSKRTTLYADVATEQRDDIPADREKTGYDIGIRHNF